jgi:hypothetical protein
MAGSPDGTLELVGVDVVTEQLFGNDSADVGFDRALAGTVGPANIRSRGGLATLI